MRTKNIVVFVIFLSSFLFSAYLPSVASAEDDFGVVEDDNWITVTNNNFQWKFRKDTGGYNEIWYNGTQIVADDRMILQYQSNPNTWKERGQPVGVTYENITSTRIKVHREYMDWAGTFFNVTYDFWKGCKTKLILEGIIGQNDTYRVVWKLSGIDLDYVQNMSETHQIKMWNDNDTFIFDYSDVNSMYGNITNVEIDWSAGNKKCDMYFTVGELTVGYFWLDPSLGKPEDSEPQGSDIENTHVIYYNSFYGFTNDTGTKAATITDSEGTNRTLTEINATMQNATVYIRFIFNHTIPVDEFGDPLEEIEGRIYVEKPFLESKLSKMEILASKNRRYWAASLYGNDTYWMEIDDVSDSTEGYAFAEFDYPEFNEKWFTKGNASSIQFQDRFMFVELLANSSGHLKIDVTHPTDTSGQDVLINKTYVSSAGITNPYFESHMPLSYTESATHYSITPPHFTIIGVHEVATGTTNAYNKGNTSDWTTDSIEGVNWSSTGWRIKQVLGTSVMSDTISRTIYLDFDEGLTNLSDEVKISFRTRHYGWVQSGPSQYGTTYNQLGGYSWQSHYWGNQGDGDWSKYDTSNETAPSWTDGNYTIYGKTYNYIQWSQYIRAGIRYWNTTDTLALFESGTNIQYKSYYNILEETVNRTIGSASECNEFNWTGQPENYTGDAIVGIPVSTNSNGVAEVYNITSGTTLTETDSMENINETFYYYDSARQIVFFCIQNANMLHHYYVNTTYGTTFAVYPPSYLRAGDGFTCRGVILNDDGNPISGFLTTTKIINSTGTALVASMWNCTNGNYECDIATTSLIPGIYTWEISFHDSASGITFKDGGPLYLDVQIPGGGGDGGGPHASAHLYYSFFDLNTGTGLDDNFFKFYIGADTEFNDGDRVKGGKYGTYLGQTLHFKILDYFNHTIYPYNGTYESVYINYAETYIDCGINLRQFRVKNSNSSTVYFIIRGNGTDLQVGRWIPPYEETEYFLLDGVYDLTVQYYWNSNASLKGTLYVNGTSIYSDTFYWISGRSLDDVVDEVEEEGTWVYYTVFDMNTGSQLGDDYYRMYISTDVTFDETDRVKGGKYKTDLNRLLHFKVRDYWNNTIYPTDGTYENITIVTTKTFLDLGMPFHQFLIKNTNDTLIYLKMTDGDFSDPINQTWYNRWVPPGESIELFVRSAIYNISLQYYNPFNASFIKYENTSNLTVYTDTFFVIQGYNARIYFNIYNTNEGLGVPFETLKLYVDNLRLPNNYIDTYIGSNLTIFVKDFYDYELYNSTVTISNPLSFLDLPLIFYSYKFSNMYNDHYVVGLKRNGSSTWWEKIVTPYETIEFVAPMGNYSIRVYNITLAYAEFNTTVNSSKAFVIESFNLTVNLSLVLEGQQTVISTLSGQLSGFNSSSSSHFYSILADIYYSNQTLQSIDAQFRLPHEWMLPDINYSINDTYPPISSITAANALGGGINVRWVSSDALTYVSYTTIYYRIANASWRIWKSAALPSDEDTFDDDVLTLVNGTKYWFKCIGVDIRGNVENETDTNICNITYVLRTLPDEVFGSVSVMAALTDMYLWIIIGALLVILIAIGVYKKSIRRKIIIEERRRRRPIYLEEAF